MYSCTTMCSLALIFYESARKRREKKPEYLWRLISLSLGSYSQASKWMPLPASGSHERKTASPRSYRVKNVLNKDKLCWKDPSCWEKVVIIWKALPHPIQIARKQIFSADLTHSWEMVDFLEVRRRMILWTWNFFILITCSSPTALSVQNRHQSSSSSIWISKFRRRIANLHKSLPFGNTAN